MTPETFIAAAKAIAANLTAPIEEADRLTKRALRKMEQERCTSD